MDNCQPANKEEINSRHKKKHSEMVKLCRDSFGDRETAQQGVKQFSTPTHKYNQLFLVPCPT